MPPTWKYMCCGCCDIVENKRAPSSSRSRRHRANKNTWTRRKLLETGDDVNCMHGDQLAYQMRTITDTPVRDLEDDNEECYEDRIFDNFAPKKRPAIQDVFDTTDGNSNVAKTTFPWMDDRFVPNERSRTRLGISSVQMNAKRTEVRNNIVSENVNSHIDNAGRNYDYQQTNHGKNVQIYRNNYQLQNACSNQANAKPNGHVIRNNIVTAPTTKPNNVRHVVNVNTGNRPMVFKESSSDVGVRRINPSSHQTRPNRIPKLEDYNNINGGVRHYKDSSSDIGPYRPKSQGAFHVRGPSNDGDISFSSEVTFRQRPSTDTSSNVSMKRSSVPGVFSSKGSKYERIKSSSKGKHDQSMSESMYGYIPKVVQEVQASNALEGTQIDDYFMKLFHDRQMDEFGLLEHAEETSEDVPVIVTTLGSVEDERNERTHQVTSINNSETKRTGHNKPSSTHCQNNHAQNTAHIKGPTEDVPKPLDHKINVSALKANTVNINNDKSDECEDQVIMIDFPPNPNCVNKKIPVSNLTNINLNQTKIQLPKTNVIKLTESNTTKKSDEVLY